MRFVVHNYFPPIKNVRDEFKESEHPRGQPENAGQFGASGGGAHPQAKKAGKSRPGVKAEKGTELPEHIKTLKVPPAWTDVQYNDDPNADVLVTGKDAKGRPTAIYSKKFTDAQAAVKFARIKELDRKFGTIQEQNKRNRSRNPEEVECLELIMAMGIRPGSDTDTKAKIKAYGATTLEGRHVVETGEGVRLKFIGKKGVSLDLPVADKSLAAALLDRAKTAGSEGRLFDTDAAKLLSYVHSLDGGGFKTKDFRTRLGTATAAALMADYPTPKDQGSYRKAVMAVAKQVSQKLGNTPVIALQSYIAPEVFLPWQTAISQ